MPLYEYECPKCGRFERVQKFSDPLLSTCPTCGQPVEKLLSPPAIQFKGSGWYVTDYAGKSSGKDKDGGDKKAEGKDAKASEKSSGESKGGASDKKTSGSKSDK